VKTATQQRSEKFAQRLVHQGPVYDRQMKVTRPRKFKKKNRLY